MKNLNLSYAIRRALSAPGGPLSIIKAHEKTGHTTMHEHLERMQRIVNKHIQTDTRFNQPGKSDPASPSGALVHEHGYPYCIDVTTPDGDGQHHAIIRRRDGELVRHGFDFDHDTGTVTMVEGASHPTHSSRVYSHAIEQHDMMVKAMTDIVSCRASDGGGIQLKTSEPWKAQQSVSYIYAPAGVTTITAGFRANESITVSVLVDDLTAKDLQDSFNFVAATSKQEPYADEDHESKKATLRFPAGRVSFTYGNLRGEEGVIVSGAEPTSYGADSVNGKVYASWSPEFATDADYTKAVCKKKHWTFPEGKGIRGASDNPARMVAVNFVTGALTNKPAFRNMPPVKARQAQVDTEPALDNIILGHWHVAQRGNKWHVIKSDGTDEGESDSREKALGHLRALYANAPEAKASELAAFDDMVKANWSDAAREAAAESKKHKYFGHVVAKHGHTLMGGVKEVKSGHFEHEHEARDWHTAMTEGGNKEHHDPTKGGVHKVEIQHHTHHKAADTSSPLATVIARRAGQLEAIATIAQRNPEIVAREARVEPPANVALDAILARQQKERDVILEFADRVHPPSAEEAMNRLRATTQAEGMAVADARANAMSCVAQCHAAMKHNKYEEASEAAKEASAHAEKASAGVKTPIHHTLAAQAHGEAMLAHHMLHRFNKDGGHHEKADHHKAKAADHLAKAQNTKVDLEWAGELKTRATEAGLELDFIKSRDRTLAEIYAQSSANG
jgi:hypothetical protein